MSDRFLNYLEREHARLEDEIARGLQRPLPDQVQIARLKKLKLAIKDQLTELDSTAGKTIAA